MALEGNLRDLELQEVFQLLAHSRKTGNLNISAQLAGLAAVVSFERGAIVDAHIAALASMAQREMPVVRTCLQVENTVLELITWREGAFRFSARTEMPDTGVRLNTEVILVEGARRIEMWARIADRIPHARSVASFANMESTDLPMLHLVPQQWEVLTAVDGQRDLVTLADALGRDLLDVAETVYGLIETGLLTILDGARATRAHATPPSSAVVDSVAPSAPEDMWVPTLGEGPSGMMLTDPEGYDAVFDPVRVGVITPEGLPILVNRGIPAFLAQVDPSDHRALGDAAALRGDFVEALSQWSACLKTHEQGPEADHAREAIALVARLHALLYSNSRR